MIEDDDHAGNQSYTIDRLKEMLIINEKEQINERKKERMIPLCSLCFLSYLTTCLL